jgi:hypothetical protein
MFGFPGIDGMTTSAGIEFEIIKLELKAGDTLVVKTDQPLSAAQVTEVRKRAEEFVPAGVKVVVFAFCLSAEVVKVG